MPSTLSLPNALVVSAYLTRGVRLWITGRLLLSVVLLLAELEPVRLSVQQSILLVAATAALGLVDIRAWRERALLSNLGISTATVVLIGVVPAIAGEVVVAVISRL